MKKPLYKVLYVQVLAAIVIGVLLGFFFPDIGASMKPLGDGFIKLIKMLIAPVIFSLEATEPMRPFSSRSVAIAFGLNLTL